jgi:hypothetical protein
MRLRRKFTPITLPGPSAMERILALSIGQTRPEGLSSGHIAGTLVNVRAPELLAKT